MGGGRGLRTSIVYITCVPVTFILLNIIGIPGTYFDSLRNSALQKLVGGVTGGVLAIVAALISMVGAILKLKGTCSPAG